MYFMANGCELITTKDEYTEYTLYNDAWLGQKEKFERKLEYLATLAKEENWDFVDEEYKVPGKKYPILENYLIFTYDRLKQENKIAISKDGEYMCFNTGLQTQYDEDIYAFFMRNNKPNVKQKWFFVKFCKESDADLAKFSPLPEIANYFENPADLLLDRRLLPIRINYEHIIKDNRDRFKQCVSYNEHELRQALESAVKQAEKKAIRNYKTAIPQFYTNKQTGESKIQLLLPLCIKDKINVDLALVVEKQENAYIAKTVLPLDWAYMNSRRIARPDTDWINFLFKEQKEQ